MIGKIYMDGSMLMAYLTGVTVAWTFLFAIKECWLTQKSMCSVKSIRIL